MKSIFKDLVVVELATVLAGPSVGMFLAELGARVIKIENPHTNGDVTRSWRLPNEGREGNVSAYFSSINYGKEYHFLDMKNGEDLKEIQKLISQADILLTNYKKGKDVKYGMEYQDLKKENPKLIQAHLNGYESDDDRTAYDVVLQAESGYMYMNGTPESGPLKMPVAMIDVLAAHQLKEGILLALLERSITGKGSYVSSSLEKAAFANLTNQACNYLMNNFIPEPIGSLHPNIAPYGETFICKDKKALVLAIGSDRHFGKLCQELGLSFLAKDERFMNNQSRVSNRKLLYSLMDQAFKLKNRDQWMEIFIDQQIPAGAIKNMEEVFKNSVAQSMILEENIEGMLTKRLSSIAFDIQS